jgi:hypothetical protein
MPRHQAAVQRASIWSTTSGNGIVASMMTASEEDRAWSAISEQTRSSGQIQRA